MAVAVPEREFSVEHEQETDGRWLAETIDLDEVMAYGSTPQEAFDRAITLAHRILAGEGEEQKTKPASTRFRIS